MRLRSVNYAEFEGTLQEWTMDELFLGDKNLIVGKNASGKSRALSVVFCLATNLAGVRPPTMSGNFDVAFSHDDKTMTYQLKIKDDQVTKERFSVEGMILLDRGLGGEGEIFAEEIDGGKMIRFQTPPSQLAAVARRDAIQHKFLEPLYAWGSSLRFYGFGTPLGKDRFAMFVEKGDIQFDERDSGAVAAIYRRAEKEFKEDFKRAVISDMSELDYNVEGIGLMTPVSIRIIPPTPGEVLGLYVKEKSLPGVTDQNGMSQGMFRSLSLLIQINYSQMAKKSTCILIDDIGEGLDFDRSCRLIELLRRKAEESDVQLIMATNDRFVMNRVPLEEWSVMQRHGNHVKVRNYQNSRKLFEEFKFTGLSNFSFLEMDFVEGEPKDEGSRHG